MSTLTVTNIKATGETASRAVSGVAAVWVKFQAYSTNSIFDSVNVTSFTDNGTGSFTVNFNNNMANAFYSATAGKWNSTANSGFGLSCQDNDSALQDVITHENDVPTDPSACSLAVHGDLA
jgi:hypothetical protein